jgi:hypothetical protein
LSTILFLLSGCRSPQSTTTPSIEFTTVPEAGPGGAARIENIEGRAIGAKAGQQIVLFAKSGTWWVQPGSDKPFTAVAQDSTWKSSTHMGTEYAAILVEPGYIPPKISDVLPEKGGAVIAVASIEGRNSKTLVPKRIRFSGYEWDVRQVPSDSGGVMHTNSASNAWTDAKGWLHLRIAKESGEWTCAEVNLLRSLGYGSYSFLMREVPPLEPGTVLGMFTWDELEAGQNHREIDIELSQWGDPASKNAQFVVQPYYVPANVFRFISPSAALIHSFQWAPGRVSFKTAQQAPGNRSRVIAEHVFTSGIPSPGGESVHINLYIFGKSRTPQQNGVEVLIEKFEYLP